MHNRRSIRLRHYDYAQPGAYFITVCAHERTCLFGDVADGEMRMSDYGRVVLECWEAVPAHYPHVELDAFVVMPNHLHGIAVITVGATHASPLRPAHSLGTIVGSFKSAVTKRIHGLPFAPRVPVWQRNYYEHVIRDEADLHRIRTYIEHNPARWAEDEYHAEAQKYE